MALRVSPLRQCGICDRRDGEVSVVIDGETVEVCGTCWERAEDERREEEPE